MRPHQNSGMKEKKLVFSTDRPASSNHYLKDVFCCTPLLPAVHQSKSNEKGTEVTRQVNTLLAKAHRSKSKTDAYTSTTKYIQPMNKVGGSEPTSKDTKASSKTCKLTTSKSNKESSSKTKDAAPSKTYEASSYKTKEATTSKSYEATTSTKEAASLADTDLPALGLKSKKRKRSKSKSKESKRHKSSHKHASSHSPSESTVAATASSNVHTASLGPDPSFHAPGPSSNGNTASLGSTASSLVHTASSNVQVLIAHAPNCDCLKSNRTYKEKTLLNTSISPIKKIVQAKGVQTDEQATKNDIIETDKVKKRIRSVSKAVQTDNVIIVYVGSQTIREQSPDFYDDETLHLDTLPSPNSQSTAINLAKALQDIKAEKTSVLEHLCPTGVDVSRGLSQNDLLQKMKLITEDKAETAEESPGVVKMELLDGDMRPHQNSGMKEKKLVFSTDRPASSNNYLKDVFCCTPLLPAVHHSKSNEKGTEVTRQVNTQLAKAHRSKSKTDAYTTKYIQPMNKVSGSEPTSKDTKASSKTCKLTTSKSNKESSSKTKDAATSKTYEASSYKTKEATTSKSYEATTSTKEAASLADTDLPALGLKCKKRKRSKSKSKESKRHKSSHKHASSHSPSESTDAAAASSNVHIASLGPVPSFHAPGASSNVHTASLGPVPSFHAPGASSNVHTASLGPVTSFHAPGASSNVHTASLGPVPSFHAPGASSNVHTASLGPVPSFHAPGASSNVHTASLGPVPSFHAPGASSNVHTASLGPVPSFHAPGASSNVHTASLRPVTSFHAPGASSNVHTASLGPVPSFHAPGASSNGKTASLGSTASSLVHTASSNVRVLIAHAPNCDCLKSNRTYKEKTLLNTSISPIKKIVEAKGVQTDEHTTKHDIVETDKVKKRIRSVSKAVQTDNVIIVHVGSQTIREHSPDFYDDETLLLDTLPAPHSHSTVINLAKALQDIKAEKTSVLKHLCPTGADVSRGLSQNDLLQKMKLITEDKAETAEESPGVVKMELLDEDLPNTSTEILVNNLYKDIMKAKEQETSKGMKPERKVTKRGLWKILDAC